MKRKPLRQGDVLLVPVKDVPAGCKPVERVGARAILAEGEATGHHHAISDAEVDLVIDDLERRFLTIGSQGATLMHEEHCEACTKAGVDIHTPSGLPHTGSTVAPGKYEVLIQVEYAPGELRRVAD